MHDNVKYLRRNGTKGGDSMKKGFTGFQLFMVAVILIILYFLTGMLQQAAGK